MHRQYNFYKGGTASCIPIPQSTNPSASVQDAQMFKTFVIFSYKDIQGVCDNDTKTHREHLQEMGEQYMRIAAGR